MSLLSSIVLPKLERELVQLTPDIQQFLLAQLKIVAGELIEWAESKLNIDLNNDGTIGEGE